MNSEFSNVCIKKVCPTDEEVTKLIYELDKFQIGLYGLENCNLDSPESLKVHGAHMLGAYFKDKLAAIGAVKLFPGYGEIKRMFVDESFRSMGLAEKILAELEKWVKWNNRKIIRLQTGKLHVAALHFYKKMGYVEIDYFGNYKDIEVSVYFEKILS